MCRWKGVRVVLLQAPLWGSEGRIASPKSWVFPAESTIGLGQKLRIIIFKKEGNNGHPNQDLRGNSTGPQDLLSGLGFRSPWVWVKPCLFSVPPETSKKGGGVESFVFHWNSRFLKESERPGVNTSLFR